LLACPALLFAKLGQSAAPFQVIALADSVGPNGAQEALAAAQAQLADAQRQLAEGEAVRRGLDAELARLRRQLAEEQSERGALEEQLAQHLDKSEDFMAQVRQQG
jgi:septal ring factor EnvC (AmiA/AmiB activator)